MNAPTLLVGLGGTGSEIVQKVFERATPKQRENIGFVIFDTDVNELRIIEEKTPQIRTVQTSTRLTVGEYLDFDRYSRDTWFPVNRILNGKALTEGAGQVRAVSRLAINTAIQQGRMAPLDEAIEALYKLKGQKTVQAPRVILAGSLCGGTGSGLILPVAMYIRNFMSTRLQQGSAIIRGFFLLPEVFDGVIKTQSERNNLRSNAYAAVREIDAFMMKDDGSLPEKYDLHFMAPRAGSTVPEEYTGRPMDFCFLFDAQNLNGMKLNSFAEYKEHAANCIYGMAIAPTSKRSNSSEDNVIREIVYAGGRNRFAGAGSSMLIYPVEDVKRYLALNWTKESISEEWLEIDRRFADEKKTNRNMRKKGYQVAELDRGNHYIQVVNQGFEERRPFPSAIRNLCYEFEPNGFVESGVSWIQYADALDALIASNIAAQQTDLRELMDKIERVSSNVKDPKAAGEDGDKDGDSASVFEDWYNQLLGFKSATIKCTSALARNVEYSLFKENKDFTKTDQTYRMEYWLHHNRNIEEFIHPNAVRYFLYNARNELQQREAEKRDIVREVEAFWQSFEKKTFDLEETQHHVETQDEYLEASHLRDSGIKRLLHWSTIRESRDHLVESFSKLYQKTLEYWDAYVSCEIYRGAISYIGSLCSAYHDFYDVLDRSISRIDKDIAQLEQKYVTRDGQALRYVCADADCLRGLAEEVVNQSSSLDIPSELNSQIFNRMKRYALAEQKPQAENYFMNTFSDTVVAYLEQEILGHYSSVVEMDVLSALEKEAHYKNPDTVYELDDERLYAQHVIESTELLAQPFIESPIGKEARVIPACAYNPALAAADFPMRKEFVSKHLRDGGGVEDESIERNMILFYQAVYDLRANELSKFAPPRAADTYGRPGGEYYKAYYDLIANVNPDPQKSKAITPHINRWWHVISKLPDLDETSQKHQEREIDRAFFWGMLGKYVEMRQGDNMLKVYELDKTSLSAGGEKSSEALIVSNGTPCDHLYEVLDAFTIYPAMVRLVLDKVDNRIENALYRKKALEESMLYELLAEFRVQEYALPGGGVRSVFELPLLMKRSVPAEEYFEENVIRLTETIFAELKDYLARFCSKKELTRIYGGLILSQFRLFLTNTELEQVPGIYQDSLFLYICKSVTRVLDELNMEAVSKELQGELHALGV